MEPYGKKGRSISFYSGKNESMITVYSQEVKGYADSLETNSDVKNYEVHVPLSKDLYININPIDIRKVYFEEEWTSDFLLHYIDGTLGVRELVWKDALNKRAVIEQIELSRRYWSLKDVKDWKLVVLERKQQNVF